MSEQTLEKHSEMYLRNRKARLMMPVLIVPIVTIFFWLMGGGTGVSASVHTKGGLNMQLPDARVTKDSAKDKMSFYAAAAFDSSKRSEQMKMDPYRKDTMMSKNKPMSFAYSTVSKTDPLQEKIAAIQRKVLAADPIEPVHAQTKAVAEKVFTPDPEMEAINATLDKLAAIQHPEKTSAVSNGSVERAAYAVNAGEETDTTYFGKRKRSSAQPGFYNGGQSEKHPSNIITAVIPSEQILQSGSIVKLELKSAITVNGIVIPAGTNVFGVASLDGERLKVLIPSIHYQNHLLPVALNVYDMDGLEGIYVPGSIARDAIKSSAESAIQSAGGSGFSGFDLKTQAAAAGVGAIKNIVSKKVKVISVTMTAGYQVLLRDNKTQGQ
ncbi:MAG: conjugative transposon protein TraM [Bacteroidota bacterium]